MAINQGDIIYVDKKYTDLSDSEQRQCLVISNSALSNVDEVIVLKITNTKRNDGFDYEIKDEMLTKPGSITGVVRLNDVQSLSLLVFERRNAPPAMKKDSLREVIEKFSENIEVE